MMDLSSGVYAQHWGKKALDEEVAFLLPDSVVSALLRNQQLTHTQQFVLLRQRS